MAMQRGPGTGDGFAAEVAALKKELERFEASARGEGANAERVISETAREFLSKATAFVDSLGSTVHDAASQSARAAASQVKATACEGTQRLEDAIRQHPLTAVAVALGAGCVVSLLLRRR